jgi:uncharacterized phage protein (TIGR02220 family)
LGHTIYNNTIDNDTKDRCFLTSQFGGKNRSLEVHQEILTYLNKKLKKKYNGSGNTRRGNFKLIPDTITLIDALLQNGYSLDDFRHVIDVKIEEWWDHPRFNQHLAPSTLFSPSNFEKYLAQDINQIIETKKGGTDAPNRKIGKFGAKSGPRRT